MTVDELYALWNERDARYMGHHAGRPPRALSRLEVSIVRQWRANEAAQVSGPGCAEADGAAITWEPPLTTPRGRRYA